MKKFVKNKYGDNLLLNEEDFYISYKKFKDGEETALKGKDGLWRILEGDFRKEYQEVFPDYEKCLEVYNKNIDKRSNWSTD